MQEELGVDAADESRAYITFLVPKSEEQRLPACLQTLEQRRQMVSGWQQQAGCLARLGLGEFLFLMT